jgi:hypothetical protein
MLPHKSGEDLNMKKLFAAAALAFAIPSIACAANVAGTWNFQLTTDQGAIPVSCTLTQAADNAVSGTCGGGMMAPSPTTGAVTGDDVTFNYDVDFGGTPLHVVYTGHVAADGSIAGNFAAGPPGGATAVYTGTFTGSPAPTAPPPAAS